MFRQSPATACQVHQGRLSPEVHLLLVLVGSPIHQYHHNRMLQVVAYGMLTFADFCLC